MKRELPGDHSPGGPVAGADAFADRLSILAAGLREDGVEPTRDLWPDIERELGAGSERGRRAARAGNMRPWNIRHRYLRHGAGAALAATVLVAIGLGVADLRPGRVADRATPVTRGAEGSGPARATGPGAAREGLRAVDAALEELQAALRQSPDDPDLSRLVMLIHHSRGRLLRLQAEGGVRDAQGGRG